MNKAEALLFLGFKIKDTPTEKDIKNAYKKEAIKCHPDKLAYPKDATKEQRETILKESTETFEALGQARDYLLDPDKKDEEAKPYWEPFNMTYEEARRFTSGYIYDGPFGFKLGNSSSKFSISYMLEKKKNPNKDSFKNWENGVVYFNNLLDLCILYQLVAGTSADGVTLSSDYPLPNGISKLIFDAIKSNRNILEIDIEDNMLTKEDRAELDKILFERNYPLKIEEKQKQIRESMASRFSLSGMLLGSFFFYHSFSVGIACAVAGYFLGTLASKLRYKEMINAAESFEEDEEEAPLDKVSDSERASLQAGLKAENWTGYFKSYTTFCSYNRKPFLAGMTYSMCEDTKKIDKINKTVAKP